MSKNLTIIFITIIFILLAIVGYFVFQNQQLISKLTSQQPTIIQPSPQQFLQSPIASPSPANSPLTKAATQNAIKSHLSAKDYEGLASYMTDSVSVILQATECCGPLSPTETANQMSYLDPGVPYDFNQNSAIVQNLKDKNSELADTFIGISTNNEYLVAFSINIQNKIESIRMSVSWKLFNN